MKIKYSYRAVRWTTYNDAATDRTAAQMDALGRDGYCIIFSEPIFAQSNAVNEQIGTLFIFEKVIKE